MLWLTTCASIALVLATLGLLGWRRERREDALSDDFSTRVVRPQQQSPARKPAFAGTIDRIRVDAKRRAG